MVSSFYSSNQAKLKKYTADRRIEERNGDIHQAKLYQKLAEERGDIQTADRLAKLGINIVKKIGDTQSNIPLKSDDNIIKQNATFKDHLLDMIQRGTLSNWFEAVKKIDPKRLSKKARIIQKDIKHNDMLKQVINDHLSKVMELKYAGIIPIAKREKTIRDAISGLAGPDEYKDIIPVAPREKTIKDDKTPESIKDNTDKIIEDIINDLSGGDVEILDQINNEAGTINANLSKELSETKPVKPLVESDEETEADTTADFNIRPRGGQEKSVEKSRSDIIKKIIDLDKIAKDKQIPFKQKKDHLRKTRNQILKMIGHKPEIIIDQKGLAENILTLDFQTSKAVGKRGDKKTPLQYVLDAAGIKY